MHSFLLRTCILWGKVVSSNFATRIRISYQKIFWWTKNFPKTKILSGFIFLPKYNFQSWRVHSYLLKSGYNETLLRSKVYLKVKIFCATSNFGTTGFCGIFSIFLKCSFYPLWNKMHMSLLKPLFCYTLISFVGKLCTFQKILSFLGENSWK